MVDDRGGVLGHAFLSRHSKITLRVFTRDADDPAVATWIERGRTAAAYRLPSIPADTTGYRLVFGESDGVPGLILDRYGEHVVAQCLTAGAERVLDDVLAGVEDAGLTIGSVLLRNDPAVRTLEGLPREVRQHRGTTPERIEIAEHGVRFEVDPWRGQKTGAFLDQRENRRAAAALARGRVLDVCTFHGSFALHAAPAADTVLAIDSSAAAIDRARDNARLNGARNVEFRVGSAFDEMKALGSANERFDVVMVDPPAFAKSRRDVAAARRGYKDLNLRAMRLASEGGILMTSSCSYHMSESEFLDVLTEAAADAHRAVRILERRTQARDHPIRLGFPESQYLKCLVLNVM